MAKLKFDASLNEITDLVEWRICEEGNFRKGKFEKLESELEATRNILGRLIDAIANKKLLDDSELTFIIRGY